LLMILIGETMKIPTNKWFWIIVIVLILVGLIYAGDRFALQPYVKKAKQLQEQNEKLKAEAKVQEEQYVAKFNDFSRRTIEISKQLVLLQKQNQDLVKKNAELEKKQLEWERQYALLEAKLKTISIPASRMDRVKLLRSLGY